RRKRSERRARRGGRSGEIAGPPQELRTCGVEERDQQRATLTRRRSVERAASELDDLVCAFELARLQQTSRRAPRVVGRAKRLIAEIAQLRAARVRVRKPRSERGRDAGEGLAPKRGPAIEQRESARVRRE